MMKHGNYYTCKRMRLLEYLLRNGYVPVETVPDPQNWKYKHWIFENTGEEFEACIERYFEGLKKNA